MPTHRITFEIDVPGVQADAVRGLGDQSVDDSLPLLASVALREWLEWLVADDRPASLTEMRKRRVKALVDAGLLPRIPTAPVIARRARLTLGQARYIVASLALEDPGSVTEVREGLVGRLRAALERSGIEDPDHLDDRAIAELATHPTNIVLDIPRTEGDLAAATHEELLNARFMSFKRLDIDEFEPPRRRRKTDSYVRMDLRPHVAVTILQALLPAPR